MYCKKCGNQVEQNACFCEKCGALCGGNLFVYSRERYFNSQFCSKKSKVLTNIAWVLVVLLSALLIYSLISAMQLIAPIMERLSACKDFDSVFDTMENISRMVIGEAQREELMSAYGSVDKLIEFISIIFNTTVIVSAVALLAVVLLSIIAIYKKSFKCSIWAAVICALSFANWYVFGISMAIAIFASSWNKEYKEYCANPQGFGDDMNFDFS